MFGTALERVWGGERFLVFYLITGLGAMLLHMAVQAFIIYKGTGTFDPLPIMLTPHSDAFYAYFIPTVGASGAIFGILAAFGLLFPNTELLLLFFPIPIKAKYFVSFYILWELYRGFVMEQGDNVAHFAHLGGALFGFIMIKLWSRDQSRFY